MADQLVRFCNCIECGAVVEETVSALRWFELEFCTAECLKKFIRKNATNCFECRNGLAQHHHVIKSVIAAVTAPETVASTIGGQPTLSTSNGSLFATKYFCSADCLNTHKTTNLMCDYCLKLMAKVTNRIGTMGAGSQRHIAFCSEECCMLMHISNNMDQLIFGTCDNCSKDVNTSERYSVDGVDYTLCSENCADVFRKEQAIDVESCDGCSRLFAHKNGTVFDMNCGVFCGAKCMVRYMMTVKRPSICVQCSVVGNYYTMIRSAQNMLRRSWCSLECALKENTTKITEEEVIDLT